VSQGKHLIVDLLDCRRDRLADPKFLCDLLYEIPTRIGMRILLPPIVIPWGHPSINCLITKEEDWGYTGLVVIAESHATFHTWPDHELRKANFDIFSCRPFDHQPVLENLRNLFGAGRVEHQVIDRA